MEAWKEYSYHTPKFTFNIIVFQAYGFKLEALLSLTGMKYSSSSASTSGRPAPTLLHFVLRHIAAKRPDCLDLFRSGWKHVWLASELNFADVTVTAETLEKQFASVRSELMTVGAGGVPKLWADGLLVRLNEFISTKEGTVGLMKRRVLSTRNELQDLCHR